MSAGDLHEYLHANPLPAVDGDKDDRGSAIVVAGAPTCPGAAVLAAVAALRAGAGRVQVVTHPAIATAIGVVVPEAFVTGWDLTAPLPAALAPRLEQATAVLVGPGLDDTAVEAASRIAEHLPEDTALLVDARAIPAVAALAGRHLLLLPNVREAEQLGEQLGMVGGLDDLALAEGLAKALGSVVAVRGEATVVVGEGTWTIGGHHGLGTAGSGDVLVGIAAGLAARRLPDLQAVAWAVAVHGTAGSLLGRGRTNPGYLARELLDAIPAAIDQLGDGCCR